MSATSAERTYRISGIQPYLMLLVLAILTAFSPFALGHAISHRSWFELAWAAVVIWFWVTTIWRAAYRFDVSGDTVEFRSILWRRRTHLNEIHSIQARGPRYVIIRFEGGRAELYGTIDGWRDFIKQVKAANPAIELRGRLRASDSYSALGGGSPATPLGLRRPRRDRSSVPRRTGGRAD